MEGQSEGAGGLYLLKETLVDGAKQIPAGLVAGE